MTYFQMWKLHLDIVGTMGTGVPCPSCQRPGRFAPLRRITEAPRGGLRSRRDQDRRTAPSPPREASEWRPLRGYPAGEDMTSKGHNRATYRALCPFWWLKTETVQDRMKDGRTLPSLVLKAPVKGPVLEDVVSKPRTLFCLLLANCGCPSRQGEEARVTIKLGRLPPGSRVKGQEEGGLERLMVRHSNNQHQ